MHKHSPGSIVKENVFGWTKVHTGIYKKLSDRLLRSHGSRPSHTGNTAGTALGAACTCLTALPADIRSNLDARDSNAAAVALATPTLPSGLKISDGKTDDTFKALGKNVRIDFDYSSEKRSRSCVSSQPKRYAVILY